MYSRMYLTEEEKWWRSEKSISKTAAKQQHKNESWKQRKKERKTKQLLRQWTFKLCYYRSSKRSSSFTFVMAYAFYTWPRCQTVNRENDKRSDNETRQENKTKKNKRKENSRQWNGWQKICCAKFWMNHHKYYRFILDNTKCARISNVFLLLRKN